MVQVQEVSSDELTKFLSRHCIEHVDNIKRNKSSSGKTFIILLFISNVLFNAKTEGISDQIDTTINSNGNIEGEEIIGKLMLVCEDCTDGCNATNG